MRFVSDSSIVWDGDVCTAVRLCVRMYVRSSALFPLYYNYAGLAFQKMETVTDTCTRQS